MRVDFDLLPDPSDELRKFKRELPVTDLCKLLRRRIVTGPAYVYPNHDHRYELCEAVADKLSVHPAKVLIVGSAKLGFSIAPDKRYRHFGDTSDIDVVVVDSALFDRIWVEIHKTIESRVTWPNRNQFAKYLLRGWIRPDLFPAVSGDLVGDWWDMFVTLSKAAGIKVAGAVYRDWYFLEAYQIRALNDCRSDLQLAQPILRVITES
jgi:hypothetical protein